MTFKLALGTVQFGLDYGISNKRGQVPKKEVFEILKYAWKHKIDVLDTAVGYGESEKIIGQFIKKNKLPFKIVSKLPTIKLSEVKKTFFQSLKNLNQESLYGYLIHDFQFFCKNPKVWNVLGKLKSAGKVKKIGFSLYFPRELKYLFKRGIPLDIIQFPYNVFDQRFKPYFSQLKKKNIEIHVRSVFLQGLIFKEISKLKGKFLKLKSRLVLLRQISKKYKVPLSIIVINFVLLNKNIDKVVIGVDSLANLKENIDAVKYQNKVKGFYNSLLTMKEEDENIILPFKWE